MKLTVLLWDVESGMNLGLALRTCYMLGNGVIDLKIFDPQSRMKEKASDVRLFSSYAVDYYLEVEICPALDSMLRFVEHYRGRVVCACNDEEVSTDLDHFTFRDNDLVVFGNEYYGIPETVLKRANEKIVIPMYGSIYSRPDPEGKLQKADSTRSYSLSASIAIILFQAVRQVTKYKDWRDSIHASGPRST